MSSDCICSDYLKADQGKIPFLYVGAVNTPPEEQAQYLSIGSFHLETDADYVELRTVEFGNHWPATDWNKHQVVHCDQWAQRWTDTGNIQSGINTEIVRSKYEVVLPESQIVLRFPSIIDVPNFDCCLYPGQVLLFTPNKIGCHLYFTFKLYKFLHFTHYTEEKRKKGVFNELQHINSLLNPVGDVLRLIAKLDPALTSEKRHMIIKNLEVIDRCVAELIEIVV